MGKQSYCRACMSEYRQSIPKEIRNTRSRASYQTHKNNPINTVKSLLSPTNVDRSALDFEWVWERLVAGNFRCEITGTPFIWEKRHPQGLSIDRIDPSKGYTKENVRFVCWWLNAAMGTWGLAALKQFIKDL